MRLFVFVTKFDENLQRNDDVTDKITNLSDDIDKINSKL